MKVMTVIYAGLLSIISSIACSDPSQSGGNQALEEATFLLNNPAAREAYIRNNDSAQKADRTLRDLAGSDQTADEIYRLASDVFANIMLKANGDPDKIMQLLQEAQQNPQAFANSFTPEKKKMLGDLARQVERNRQ